MAIEEASSWAFHVDHEVAQLLLLQEELGSLSTEPGRYPQHVWRALRVAYAAHHRALLEFFHDGRTITRLEREAAGCEGPLDMTYSEFVGAGAPRFPTWSREHVRRLCDADKLLGHLSQHRVAREGRAEEWGEEADLELLRPMIEDLLREAGAQGLALSRSLEIAARLGFPAAG